MVCSGICMKDGIWKDIRMKGIRCSGCDTRSLGWWIGGVWVSNEEWCDDWKLNGA